MKKLLIFFCICLAVIPSTSLLCNTAYNSELASYAPEVFFLANSDTDTVIFSKNENMISAPASLVKIATAVLALEFCENLDTQATVSESAIAPLLGTGSTVAGLVAGEKLRMRDLLYCLLLPGANDAANVIAEQIAKEIPVFINLMNDFAKAIGCKNTNFVNAHGLDGEGQTTSASDMYLILKHAIKTPMFKEIIAEYDYTVPKTNKSAARNIYNRNPLVNSYSDYYYKYSVGGITGSTQQSGECLASVAQKDGYTYICIAMKGSYERINGSTDKFNTSFVASKKMYQWAFENMKLKIVSDTSRIVDEIKVRSAEDADYVSLVPEKEITALVPLSAQTEGLSIVTDITTKPESVAAPVRKGQIIAQADIYYSKTVIARVNLVALNDVQRSEKEAIVFALKDFFASKPFFVVLIIFTAGIFVFVASAYTKGKKKPKKKKPVRKPEDNRYTGFKK